MSSIFCKLHRIDFHDRGSCPKCDANLVKRLKKKVMDLKQEVAALKSELQKRNKCEGVDTKEYPADKYIRKGLFMSFYGVQTQKMEERIKELEKVVEEARKVLSNYVIENIRVRNPEHYLVRLHDAISALDVSKENKNE